MTTGKRARNATVTWTRELRLGLHLLHQEFNFRTGSKTAIFTSLFKDHLRRCGFLDGQIITNKVIYAQYHERLKPGRGHLWDTILRNPETVAEKEERQSLVNRIAQTAHALGYEIQDHSLTSYLPTHSRLRPETLQTEALSNEREQGMASMSTIRLTDCSTLADVSPTPSVSISKAEQKREFAAFRANTITSPRIVKRVKRATLRTSEATFLHRINDDCSITLPERIREEVEGPLVFPSYDVAHPPLAGLLFRVWTDQCQSPLNCDSEFIAGRFRTMIRVLDPPPPPMEEYPQWMDMGIHLQGNEIATPFISTSNNLAWIFRLAVRKLKDGLKNVRITVIDSCKIERQRIYHVKPFQCEILKKRPYTKGVFRYHGTHEFFIYGKIPNAAIFHTVNAQSLLDLAKTHASIGEALRLNELSAWNNSYTKTVLPMFKAQKITLTSKIIRAIADIAKFLGLNADSSVEFLSHIISETISGWGLLVEHRTSELWQEAAQTFAVAMSNGNGSGIPKYHEKIKLAFLDGAMWSLGDPNTRHQRRKIQTMRFRAKKVGLVSPAKILVDAMDAAKLHLIMFEQAQHKLFPSNNAQPLLTGFEEDDEEEDDPFEEEVGIDENESVVL